MRHCGFFHSIGLFCAWGLLLAAAPLSSNAQVSVLSYHNDPASTGQNLNETRLTPASINFAGFGKIYASSVDGQIFAQPLYVPGVTITAGASQGTHNVVYVATQHNTLYALDSISGAPLWSVRLVDAAGGETPVSGDDTASSDISPEVGVTSTPVIDPNFDPVTSKRYIYVFAKSVRQIGGLPHYYQRLHAIDIASGAPKNGSPVTVAETVRNADGSYTYVSGPSVAGTGDGAVNGLVTYNALRQHQRPGLSLVNGKVYVASASHGDNGPYHGWVLGFDASTLALSAVFNATPNGGEAGIWMGGGIVSADGSGALYCITGNGAFGSDNTAADPLPGDFDADGFPLDANYGNSFLKLVPDGSTAASPGPNGWGLKVADYFCPYNQKDLNHGDTDLGSGGVLILPDAAGSAAHPRLLIGAGKEGRIYLIDRDDMGKFRGGVSGGAFRIAGGDQVVQVTGPNAINGCLGTPAYFGGKVFFVGAYSNDHGKAFSMANGVFNAVPVAQTPDSYGYLGSTPSVSANGTNNGIVWCIDRGSNQLRAYDANNFNSELYTSGQGTAGRDRLGNAVKFGVPTVADGLVFVGTSEFAGPSALVCYGQYSPPSTPPAQPVNLFAQTISGGEIDLFWTENANNETGYEAYVSLDPNNFPATSYATTAADAGALAVKGLQVSTTYYFRVRAVNSVGSSAYSNTSASTSAQAPPVDFSSGFNGKDNLLTFNGFGGNSAIVGAVLRLTDGAKGQTRTAWLTTAQTISQFSTEFTFKVTNPTADGFTFAIQRAGLNALGIGGGGQGSSGINTSAAIKFDIFPGSATGLYLNGAFTDDNPDPTANSSGSIDVTGAGIDFHSTHVFKVTLTYDGATLRQTITDTVSRQSFTKDYAINLAGVLGGSTAYVGFTAATGDLTSTQEIQTWSFTPSLPTAPAAPTTLSAAAASGTQINLAWTDHSNNETGFRVERKDGANGSFASVGSVGANTALFIDANLLTDTTYTYRVVATNVGLESAPSNTAAVTTPIAPTTPSGAIAAAVTANSIDFRWNDNSDNETGFRILRKVGSGEFFILATLPPNSATYQDANLQPDTDYDYHIQAFNAAGYVDFTGFGTKTLSSVNLVASDASAQEGTANPGAFAVRRSNALSAPLTVNYTISTATGQAAYGTRYTMTPAPASATSGSVTIPAGSPATTIVVNPLADGAVLGAQNVTLTLAAGAGYTAVSGGATAAVQLLDSPANAWKVQQFGSVSAAQSALAADAADYDGDGVSNLVEYALGSNPTKSDPASLPVTKIETVDGGSYLTLTFRRPRPAPVDITYLVETTATLGANSWQAAVMVTGYPLDNGDGTETVKARASQPVTANAQSFIHLRIARP
jgi:hypothetical protein